MVPGPAHPELAVTAPANDSLERLSRWNPGHRVRIFRGPEVYEIQLVPRINKSFGVRMLCRIMEFTPASGTLFYAGDDENDALAMRFVTRLGRNGDYRGAASLDTRVDAGG